jgi:hypothetical protein
MCFHYYEFQFNGNIYKPMHGSHLNTFKKYKMNGSLKTIYILSFLGKLFTWKNCLNWKIACIEKILN